MSNDHHDNVYMTVVNTGTNDGSNYTLISLLVLTLEPE